MTNASLQRTNLNRHKGLCYKLYSSMKRMRFTSATCKQFNEPPVHCIRGRSTVIVAFRSVSNQSPEGN